MTNLYLEEEMAKAVAAQHSTLVEMMARCREDIHAEAIVCVAKTIADMAMIALGQAAGAPEAQREANVSMSRAFMLAAVLVPAAYYGSLMIKEKKGG